MITIYTKQSSKKLLFRRKSYNLVSFQTWVSVQRLPQNPALFSKSEPDMSPWSNENQHLVSGQLKKKNRQPWWALNLSPRYGQWIAWYDSCQLNIICMSDIKDICCNPRLHDLVVSWMATMLCKVVVVVGPMCLWSMPLAILNIRKELHGFLFLCLHVVLFL